ncbi:hypothetical protein BJY21_001528 [Kineosphaera limosa]|nr:hypothetical protein [Kineosphaera limosa]NYE00344.1 hypothetical protein [Kineosphaera limosa]
MIGRRGIGGLGFGGFGAGASAAASPGGGVCLPKVGDRRSSAELGRRVVADALAAVDESAARAALGEAEWRAGYPRHFRELLERGASDPARAAAIASEGLASVHHHLQWRDPATEPEGDDERGSAREVPLAQRPTTCATRLEAATVHGNGEPERILSIPYAGRRLFGDELRAQLDLWVLAGVVEPDAADAVRRVMANPQWLSLPGRTAVVLGAASQIGPLRPLLRWGADVAALDLPGPQVWAPLLADVRGYAGRLTVPVVDERQGAAAAGEGGLADHAGADLVRDLPAVATWLEELTGDLVLGAYAYADGAQHVRVAAAVDDLTYRLLQRADRQVALAFLATPTDVFAVPDEARVAAWAAFERRDVDEGGGLLGRLGPVARGLGRGRLLVRHYDTYDPAGGAPPINDSIVTQQGPNYLLAKRIQRWRAYEARQQGHLVSFSVAPPTRTRSVLKNRALAAAYAGAHRFGVEVFEPATSSTLMAALLVHDLYAGGPAPATPWQAEAAHAVHGGLWRTPVEPRSALTLAALAGLLARP